MRLGLTRATGYAALLCANALDDYTLAQHAYCQTEYHNNRFEIHRVVRELHAFTRGCIFIRKLIYIIQSCLFFLYIYIIINIVNIIVNILFFYYDKYYYYIMFITL